MDTRLPYAFLARASGAGHRRARAGLHDAGGDGGNGLQVLAGRRSQQGAGHTVLLSGRLFEGCSVEAHYFAESMPQFEALGATVIGVSGDDIDTLSKFSVQACQSKFPVASDEKQSVMKSYDAVLKTRPEYANRISYVIAPSGAIVFSYMSLNPTKHVEKTLGALRGWSETKK
jgi:peroxiredoxin